jgi:trk system potassium uptake protein
MTRTVLIVGGGRVGGELARRLASTGHDVTVVDPRPDRAAWVTTASPTVRFVVGDGADAGALEDAGIRSVDVLAAVTPDDALNLLVTSLARFEFGVGRTIARIVDPAHAWLFGAETGVDVALDQSDLLTRLIVEEMSLGDVATLVKLRRGDLTLVEERIPTSAAAVGQPLGAIAVPAACALAAVLRGDEVLVAADELVLRAGDEVLAVVHEGAAAELSRVLSEPADTARHP